MSSNEIYTVDLLHCDNAGKRRLQFHADQGDEFFEETNGELVIVNDLQGSLLKISPNAWQSYEVSNISNPQEEDA